MDKPTPAGAAPGTRRAFCGVCGTKLFFSSPRWAGETHVALAVFDEPMDRAPQGHVFFEEHVDWLPPLAKTPR